jgi:hypothetical protein
VIFPASNNPVITKLAFQKKRFGLAFQRTYSGFLPASNLSDLGFLDPKMTFLPAT